MTLTDDSAIASARDHRRQQNAEHRIEHAGRDRHAGGVVDEGEEQVLPDVAHRRRATAGAPARCRCRSPLSSVTPALSIATSVPVPMAMPTSAAASAGASLTPSPAMATTRPSRLQLLDHRALLLGQHLGLDLGDAELARHRLRGGAVVAGQHDDRACRLPAAPRAPAGVVALTGSAMAMTPATLAVDGDEDRRGAVAAQRLGLPLERGGRRRRARPESAALPSATRRRSTMPIDALAGGRVEAAHRRERRCRARSAARRWRRPADARSPARRWRRAAAARPRRSRRRHDRR